MKRSLALVLGAALVSACQTTQMPSKEPAASFVVSRVDIAPMAQQNLCRQLGGQAVQPGLTISHTKLEGVPIMVRMYDVISDGSRVEHRRVRVLSEADGSTEVSSGFLPPCNMTRGRSHSSYRFDISGGAEDHDPVGGLQFRQRDGPSLIRPDRRSAEAEGFRATQVTAPHPWHLRG